jgi:perosamine synthetase
MNNTEVISTSFEPGAAPKEGTIPLCVPEMSGNEWQYVKECLDTNWVSSAGPFVNRFETMVAAYVGARFAVATASGTAALHLALLVAGVELNEEVIVSSLTFVAPVNAIRYVGAWPVFIDAEPNHWQMDPQKVADFLTKQCTWANGELRNKSTGRRVKAILPVHILGHPCDMDPIVQIAHKFELVLVEDATEALGARYKSRPVGKPGDVACFSFNGNKIITTGGGGMIVTDNERWAEKAKYLSTQAKDNPIEYIHDEVGYNYRLTNIQAALGVAQMEQLDKHIAAKRNIKAVYKEALRDLPGIKTHDDAATVFSSCWMSPITVDPIAFGYDSRGLMDKLKENNIQSRPLWHPVNSLRPFKTCQSYEVRVADQLYRDALNLPCSVGLTPTAQTRVIESIREFAR